MATARVAMQSSARSRVRYVPALDGLRAAALATVLLTHGAVSWAPGGLVGVSLFFTLSGYLITTLLLARPAEAGELRTFWGRRVRRLLPTLLVTVAAVLVLGELGMFDSPLVDIREQAASALLYVTNWYTLASGQSYEQIFSAPTPLQHAWSLAIEEQFYLVFPVVFFALRRRLTFPRLRSSIIGLWLLAVGASLGTGWMTGVDTTYLATQARFSEILAGAVLAVLLPDLLARGPERFDRPTRRLITGAGIAAVAVQLAIFFTTPDTDDLVARGMLPVIGVLSVFVVLAAVVSPVLARPLEARPLVAVGKVSYGFYLVHWPVYLYLTPARTGLSLWPLLALRVGVSAALAFAIYEFVERPVRGLDLARGRRAASLAAATALAGAVVWFAPVTAEPTVVEAAEDELARLFEPDEPDGSVDAADAQTEPAVVAVFGDSTAFFTQLGIGRWATAHPDRMQVVEGSTKVGCPLGRGGRRDYQAGEVPPGPECDWTERWPAQVAANDPDIAVLQVGPWEVADYREVEGGPWTRIGDPDHDAFLRSELEAAIDALSSSGARVVLLSSPDVQVGLHDLDRRTGAVTASEPSRMDLFNELLRGVAADHPRAEVVELAAHVERLLPTLDEPLQPDGVHFTGDAAEVVAEWLAPEILEVSGAATR